MHKVSQVFEQSMTKDYNKHKITHLTKDFLTLSTHAKSKTRGVEGIDQRIVHWKVAHRCRIMVNFKRKG